MQQDAVMACIGLWYVSATAGRVANRMPPLWRTCLGALGGYSVGLPTASGGAATMGDHGPFENGPMAAVQEHWRKRHATRPVQAIETPRIGERYPPIGVGESVRGDEMRRDQRGFRSRSLW
jgi:hypothetical protein